MLPSVSEAEFLAACPKRGEAWSCYRQIKRDGGRALFIFGKDDVAVVRVSAPNGVQLVPDRPSHKRGESSA